MYLSFNVALMLTLTLFSARWQCCTPTNTPLGSLLLGIVSQSSTVFSISGGTFCGCGREYLGKKREGKKKHFVIFVEMCQKV